MSKKKLGIIGGVGPLSTAYFLEVLTNMTAAETDQEHINSIILNHCSIPDRTAYILDSSAPNPVPVMQHDAQTLETLGCEIIATPCNTAHYFFDELQSAVKIPIINMIDETAEALKLQNAKTVGIMATNGTVFSKLFQNALEKRGIVPIIPNEKNQRLVMDIIYYNVKAGKPLEIEKFKAVTGEMRLHGCDRIILGCTELSVLKKEYSLDDYYIDSLEILCESAIVKCGYSVKRR